MTDRKDEAAVLKPFAEFVAQQRRGALNGEAGEKLAELVHAVSEVGKAGTLTIVVRVEPGKADSLEVTDDVKMKLPQPDRPAALWFADAHHNLTRENPAQQPLPIHAVDTPATKEASSS
jgi:hypothetical protein